MSPNPSHSVTQIVPKLPAPPAALAFLLDVDGTILDIAPTPADVRVPDELRGALARLDRLTGGAVALVSGRPLEDIDRIFAPLRLAAVGGHGAELRPAKDAPAVAGGAAPLPAELRQRLASIAALGAGILVEDKGYSLALHYRLAPALEDAIEAAVAAACAQAAAGTIEVLPGKAVIEIKRRGFEKATGVRALMRHPPFAGRRPLFVGDDVTDESVFAVLPEIGGVGFSVGRIFPGAAGCFDSPRDVRSWLDRISRLEAAATP